MALSSSGNIKRVYWALTLVLVILVIYQITREDILVHPGQQLQQMSGEQPQPIPDIAADPIMVNANNELARAQKILQPSVVSAMPEVEPAIADGAVPIAPDVWGVGGPAPAMPLPGGVSVYEPVSVDMENPVYPEAGQQVSVTMPGGERWQVNVEVNSTNPNGDYTWRGHVDGHGDEYPVVMTYGGSSVFATVTTPKGSYTLESVNGSGWIYKNPAEVELSNPGANDFLEIPHAHQ